MKQDNSLEAIQKWICDTVGQSTLNKQDKEKCMNAAMAQSSSLFRGDFSDMWLGMGFTNEQFNFELFV